MPRFKNNKYLGGTWILRIIKRRHIPFNIFHRPVSNSNYFILFPMQSRSTCLSTHQQIGQHGNSIISRTQQNTQRRSFENQIYWQTNKNYSRGDYLISQTNQLYQPEPNAFSTLLDFSTMAMMDSSSSACHHQTSMEATTSTTGENLLNTPVKGT